MIRDYRDKLQDLLNDLHTKEGVTRYRISKRSGISEQTLSNVMHKRRNLSIEALERLLDSIGYEVQFTKSAAPTAVGTEAEATSTLKALV